MLPIALVADTRATLRAEYEQDVARALRSTVAQGIVGNEDLGHLPRAHDGRIRCWRRDRSLSSDAEQQPGVLHLFPRLIAPFDRNGGIGIRAVCS